MKIRFELGKEEKESESVEKRLTLPGTNKDIYIGPIKMILGTTGKS